MVPASLCLCSFFAKGALFSPGASGVFSCHFVLTMRAFFTPNRVHGTCPFPSHTNVPSHPHPPQPELSSITGSPLQNSPQPPPPPRPRLATLFQQCLMDPRLQSPPLPNRSPAQATPSSYMISFSPGGVSLSPSAGTVPFSPNGVSFSLSAGLLFSIWMAYMPNLLMHVYVLPEK